ncbi:hypothetical protein SAMN02745673_01859 [Marinactinospora thermotolerans DSM 45154]|uniref:Uncharacterized protein n=1 Tax=Marinactinospora thermotolerans DSM 45154 TaxID=1122192 RepID=A0A1T4PK61_9ACTN|nr:hypothetical protein [Marinactinospora thermotolerans]SJZ91953.1 hypothetical protein SAMN02745673_01859 [Marinactinospora thermotolerans DSM 45154]
MTGEPPQDDELEAVFTRAREELKAQWRERLTRRLVSEAEQGDPTAREIVAALRLEP